MNRQDSDDENPEGKQVTEDEVRKKIQQNNKSDEDTADPNQIELNNDITTKLPKQNKTPKKRSASDEEDQQPRAKQKKSLDLPPLPPLFHIPHRNQKPDKSQHDTPIKQRIKDYADKCAKETETEKLLVDGVIVDIVLGTSGAIPCAKYNCDKSYSTLGSWWDHIHAEHHDIRGFVDQVLSHFDKITQCPHGCLNAKNNQSAYFVSINKHINKAHPTKKTKKVAQKEPPKDLNPHPQATNVINSNQWMQDGPHWNLISETNARKLVMPGRVCAQKLTRNMRDSIAGFFKKLLDENEPINQSQERKHLLTYIMLVPMLLTIKRGKYLEHNVFNKRVAKFKAGKWKELLDSTYQIIDQNRKQIHDQSQFNKLADVALAKVAQGKTASIVKDNVVKAFPNNRQIKDISQSQFPNKRWTSGVGDDDDDDDDDDDVENDDNHHPVQPQSTQHTAPLQNKRATILLTRRMILQVIGTNNTSPGITGTTFPFWKQIFSSQKQTVINMVNAVANNRVHSTAASILASTIQTVLRYKTTKQEKFRCVGGSDALVKIAAKTVMKQLNIEIANVALKSTDHAVGRRAGMEVILHKARAAYDNAKEANSKNFTLLQLDIKGAFPSTRRSMLRDTIQRDIPRMLPIYDMLYAENNTHYIIKQDGNIHEFHQHDGIIQGNELSTVFFMLHTRAIIAEAFKDQPKEAESLLQYVDDMALFGEEKDVMQKFRKLRAALGRAGLNLSLKKCNLWQPLQAFKQTKKLAKDYSIKAINPKEGVTILGVPFGTHEWTKAQLKAKANQYERRLDELSATSHQTYLKVLQYTASYFQHILAVIPPLQTKEFAQRIDQANTKYFNQTFFKDIDLSQPAGPGNEAPSLERVIQTRMTLPLRHSGMGILSLADRYQPAYLLSLLKFQNEEYKLSKAMSQNIQTIRAKYPQWQKSNKDLALSRVSLELNDFYKQQLKDLSNGLHIELRRHINASQAPGAANVVKCLPWSKLTTLQDWHLLYAVRLRMGIAMDQMFEIQPDERCACGAHFTARHAFSCTKIKHRQHDAMLLNHVVQMYRAAGVTGFQINKMVQDYQTSKDQKRPDIVLPQSYQIKNPQEKKNIDIVDFTSSIATGTANYPNKPGAAMQNAAKVKLSKYSKMAEYNDARVVPLVMDNFGSIHNTFSQHIAELSIYALKNGQYIPGLDKPFQTLWKHNFSAALLKYYCVGIKELLTMSRASNQ